MPTQPVARKTWIVAAIAAALTGAGVYALTYKPPMPATTGSDTPSTAITVISEPATTETLTKPEPQPAVVQPSLDKELANIQQLASDGFPKQALENVDTLLLSQPEHFSARLTRSQILLQLNKQTEAEALLKQLISDHPERPEPLNNMAVLIAARGDYKAAVDTLLKAFDTHPSYANVQKNLSELYATMASQAYSKALDLETQVIAPQMAALSMEGKQQSPGPLPFIPAKSVSETVAELAAAQTSQPQDTTADTAADTAVAASDSLGQDSQQATAEPDSSEQEIIATLARIEQQVNADSETQAETRSPATAVATDADNAEPVSRPEQASSGNETDSAPATEPQQSPEPAVSETVTAADSAVRSAEVPAQAASQPQAVIAATDTGENAAADNAEAEAPTNTAAPSVVTEAKELTAAELKESALRRVRFWADAWQRQDVEDYIAAYAPDYRPDNGLSHERWKRQRHSRLTRPSFIKVELSDIKVYLRSGKQADVLFMQRYSSDNYSDRTQKQIQLILLDDGWRIVREKSL
ncbi:tetratricopeptide repeat protein [Marinobacterium jannaschii]|uniref:tetratricopeptide repeat protein n=1 Tax=Marinobacterium jannaschii TaxID=64970 RepID=UPI0004849510|nr:tetratricopeptide repeat protein [Marinobacterium jannaschii]